MLNQAAARFQTASQQKKAAGNPYTVLSQFARQMAVSLVQQIQAG